MLLAWPAQCFGPSALPDCLLRTWRVLHAGLHPSGIHVDACPWSELMRPSLRIVMPTNRLVDFALAIAVRTTRAKLSVNADMGADPKLPGPNTPPVHTVNVAKTTGRDSGTCRVTPSFADGRGSRAEPPG